MLRNAKTGGTYSLKAYAVPIATIVRLSRTANFWQIDSKTPKNLNGFTLDRETYK